MERLFKMVLAVLAVASSTLLGVYFGMKVTDKQQEVKLGGVSQSNDYFSTTTKQISTGVYLVKSTGGAIGEVTITSSTIGELEILDANGSATTSIAKFRASVSEGTYTLNRALINGLTVSTTGSFNGQFSTSYR